jgi:hypothetical protein
VISHMYMLGVMGWQFFGQYTVAVNIRVTLAAALEGVTTTEAPLGADMGSFGQHCVALTSKEILSSVSQFADKVPAENVGLSLTSHEPAVSGKGNVADVFVPAIIQLPESVLASGVWVVNSYRVVPCVTVHLYPVMLTGGVQPGGLQETGWVSLKVAVAFGAAPVTVGVSIWITGQQSQMMSRR